MIDDWEVQHLLAVARHQDVVRTVGMSVEISQDITTLDTTFSITLGQIQLGTYIFWVGPLPVVLTANLDLKAGVEVSLGTSVAGTMSPAVTITAGIEAGAEYTPSSGWDIVWDPTLTASGGFDLGSVTNAIGGLEEYLDVNLETRFYGVAGPGVFVRPYIYEEMSYPPLAYEVGVGAKAGVNFEADVFGHELIDFSQTLGDARHAFISDTVGGLAAPQLYLPANGDTINDPTPFFDWSDVNGATQYQIQVDNNLSFSLPEIDYTTSNSYYTPTNNLADGTYYWRVRAGDGSNWSLYSDAWSFTVNTGGGGGQVIYIGSYNTPGSAYGVVVSGSYAYVADGTSGLQVINVSDPYNPTLADFYNTPDNDCGLFVSGSYAYVADDDFGLQVINVSDPYNLTFAWTYNTTGQSNDVVISGSYAYVADGYSGLQIINSASPSYVGSFNTPGTTYGASVSGSYAYVADMASGLQIINVSNPTNPTYVSSYNTPGSAFDVLVSGSYAYVADMASGLLIFDVSDPSNPTFVESYNTPGSAYGVFVSGSYAYVADYGSGLQVINVSDPSNPTLAGSYNTPGEAWEVSVSGSYAYVADGTSGLQILQFVP